MRDYHDQRCQNCSTYLQNFSIFWRFLATFWQKRHRTVIGVSHESSDRANVQNNPSIKLISKR